MQDKDLISFKGLKHYDSRIKEYINSQSTGVNEEELNTVLSDIFNISTPTGYDVYIHMPAYSRSSLRVCFNRRPVNNDDYDYQIEAGDEIKIKSVYDLYVWTTYNNYYNLRVYDFNTNEVFIDDSSYEDNGRFENVDLNMIRISKQTSLIVDI